MLRQFGRPLHLSPPTLVDVEHPASMEFPQTRQTRQPRLAITASFLLIAVFVIWLILPRSSSQDDIVPVPVLTKVRITQLRATTGSD